MSQFIRIKRQDHTYFMHVEPTDSFLSVKAKVAELNDRQNAGDVRIFNADRVRLLRSLVYLWWWRVVGIQHPAFATHRTRYPHVSPSPARRSPPPARASMHADDTPHTYTARTASRPLLLPWHCMHYPLMMHTYSTEV